MSLNLSKQYDFVDAKRFQWDDEGKIYLWIAPVSCKGYQDAMNAFSRMEQAQRSGFRRGMRDAELDEARQDAMRKAAAEHLIVRWEGVRDTDTGEEVPYTPERGLALLTDPDSGDAFFMDVLSAAGNVSAFRRERLEAAAKNSETLSGSGAESESTLPSTVASSSVS